jgi:6,7-dimethyl-8-ribityllumazine synthase
VTNIPEPDLDGSNLCIAIVVARFNEHITSRLLDGALKSAEAHRVREHEVHYVPGSFELPVAAMKLAKSGRFDAVICLGCVVRHKTDHYKHVSEAAARGISRVALVTGVPCLFGVLTCDTDEQALERSQPEPEGRNEGRNAVEAAIETANLLRSI